MFKNQTTKNLMYIGGVGLGILATGLLTDTKVEASEWKANSTNQIIAEMNKQKDELEVLAVYEIQLGDTLSCIADASNLTIDQIVKMNNIVNPNLIYVGEKINLGMSEQAKQYVASRGQSNVENAKTYELPTDDEAIQTILKTNNNNQTLNPQDKMPRPQTPKSTIGNNDEFFKSTSNKKGDDEHKNNTSSSNQDENKPTASSTKSSSSQAANKPTVSSTTSSSSQAANKPTASSTTSSSSQVASKPTVSSSSNVVTVNSSSIQKPTVSSSSNVVTVNSSSIQKPTVSSSSSSVQKPVTPSSSSSSVVNKPVTPSTSSSSSVVNKPVTPPTSSSKPVTPSKPSVNYTYNDLFNGVVSWLKTNRPGAQLFKYQQTLALGTNQGWDSEWRTGYSSETPKTYQVNVYLPDGLSDEQKFNKVCSTIGREVIANTAFTQGPVDTENHYAYISMQKTAQYGNMVSFKVTSAAWNCYNEEFQNQKPSFEVDGDFEFTPGDVTWEH